MPHTFDLAFSQGFLLSLGLTVAIGAQNAFVLRQGLRREHVLAIVLFCASMDVLLVAAGVTGMGRVLAEQPRVAQALAGGGAAFLIGYGLCALWRARRPAAIATALPTFGQPISRSTNASGSFDCDSAPPGCAPTAPTAA